MKNIFKTSLFSLLLLLAVGCEPTESITFNGDTVNFLQLSSSATVTVPEAGGMPGVITAILGTPQSSDVTVNFVITDSGDSASRYMLSPGNTVTIPAGETSASIEFMPINNFETDGNAEITVAIAESSSLPVGIAGEGLSAVSTRVIFVDDDCPIDIDGFVGSYSVDEVFSEGGVNAGLTLAGAFGESYQLQFALDPTDITGTKVVISNTPGFNTYIANGTVMTFDTCNGVVAFDAGNPTLALFAVHAISETSYNETAFSISASGPLGNFGAYEWVWTKQ